MNRFRDLLRNPSGALGLVLVGVLVASALVSLVWTPYGAEQVDTGASWAGPSGAHWFGADQLGRDTFSRLLFGARITLAISVGAALVAALFGLILAALVAFTPRPWAGLLERLTDVWVAFPTLIIALIFVTAFGGSTATSLLAIGLGSTPSVARTILPELRRARKTDYVLLAVAAGATRRWVLTRHIVPAVAPTLIVRVTQIMGTAALAEAGLSYLGLGTPPPTPSWGRMLAQFQEVLFSHPGAILAPGLAIFFAILGFNLLGDGLRDVLNPREERA